MNGDHEKENIGEEQLNTESDHSKEELVEELIEIEGKLIGEALSLIENGLSLIDTQDYDDAINILRQALGLYDQIGRINEVNLIRKKISEIYILKEQAVMEAPEKEIVVSDSKSEIVMEEKDQIESVESIELLANEKLEQAKNLIDIYEFDEANLIYDDAIQLYRKMNSDSKIEGVYELIDKCYDQKANFLIHGPKGEVSEAEMKSVPETNIEPVSVEQKKSKVNGIRVQRIKEYEELRLREKLISNRAYELIEKASKFANLYDFERATKLYNDAINHFKEINWEHEIKKIQKVIEQLEKDKKNYIRKVEEKREKDEKRRELEAEKVALLERKAVKIRELEEIERMKRIEELEKKKQEKEAFQKEITEMVDNAEKIAREYELEKREAIKKGQFNVESCKYPKVIEIYKKVKQILIEKNWLEQLELYNNQIKLYEIKYENDKKLYEMEIRKREKDIAYSASLKVQKAKPTATTQREKKRIEDEAFQNEITKMVDKAERIAREYELAIKQGNFDLEPPYENAIKIYEEVREMLKDKDWKEQIIVYTNQILIYKEKLEKDKKLREIESQKKEKDKAYQEALKAKKIEVVDIDKARALEEKRTEDEILQNEITEMVDKAERIAREYDLAIKQGNFDLECQYPKVIEIYTDIYKKLIEKGWNKEAKTFSEQIKICEEKLEKDKKLREIEADKIRKQKEYEESLKVRKRKIPVSANLDQTKLDKVSYKDELKREVIQKEISTMVDKALRLAREYESAVRRGNTELENPYSEIVEIYTKVRDIVLESGLNDQAAAIYKKQIQFYKKKL